MPAECVAAPHRNCEADGAAPWQRASPLDHVQVAAVHAAWLESWPRRRAPRGGDPAPSLYCCTRTYISLGPGCKYIFYSRNKTQTVSKIPDRLIGGSASLRVLVQLKRDSFKRRFCLCSFGETRVSLWMPFAASRSLCVMAIARRAIAPASATVCPVRFW